MDGKGFRPGMGGTRNSTLDARTQEDPVSESVTQEASTVKVPEPQAQNLNQCTMLFLQKPAWGVLAHARHGAPGLPFYWGLLGIHRPLMPRALQRLHLEFHCTFHNPEAREIEKVLQLTQWGRGRLAQQIDTSTSKVKGSLRGE